MALIKCPECGNQISEKAPKCPHCGCNMVDALSNKAKIEEETKAKDKVSSLVVEQDKIIEHLESSAKKEIQSVIEAQERTISKLETAMSKGYKNKRPNSGKYIFWGILCCILLIGGVFLFSNDEKKEFGKIVLLEDSFETGNDSLEKAYAFPNEKMEQVAMRNYTSYNNAIATTGVVWDGIYQNDSVRIFVKATDSATNDNGGYEYTTLEGYFYSIKDPQKFFTCKFDHFIGYSEEMYSSIINFHAYDNNEKLIGDLCITTDISDYYDNESKWDINTYLKNIDKDLAYGHESSLSIGTNVSGYEIIKNAKRILIK